ncbi:hypothetical protein MMC07_009390 [Pseudocyphellaria aurata]|nr:hypothetical protein [Pseudocyphellaria aurata]
MARITFSTLPAEIHHSIARHCEGSDLFNLCLTSKWAYERWLQILYRHVDLTRDRTGYDLLHAHREFSLTWDAFSRQQQLVHTLLSRPELGRNIRSFKGMLYRLNSDIFSNLEEPGITEEDLWSAMDSLTRVERVEIGISADCSYLMTVPLMQIPSGLFKSATSVTLVGQIQYNLAKSILSAINPEALQHLCLNLVQERNMALLQMGYMPGDCRDDGRIIARGAMSGLLQPLTGRCTTLHTLTLRRIGQHKDCFGWHAAAEEASYVEWAAFIRSVQGSVEHIAFEQVEPISTDPRVTAQDLPFRIMDERFCRLVFPTLVSGHWPRLMSMELVGVRGLSDDGGTKRLVKELKAAHKQTAITVMEQANLYIPF